jgi:hypothetical protein
MSETKNRYEVPELAGTVRFLIGLLMMVVGLYIGFFLEGKSTGLALLFFLASPFIMLKDKTVAD